jgi:hypothetical protein
MAAGVRPHHLTAFHTTLTLLHVSLLALVVLTIAVSLLLAFPFVLDDVLERFALVSGAAYATWGLGLFAFVQVRPRLLSDLRATHETIDFGVESFLRQHKMVTVLHVIVLVASVAVSWALGHRYSWSVLLGQGLVSLVIAGGATVWLVASLRALLDERKPVFARRNSAQTTSVVGM